MTEQTHDIPLYMQVGEQPLEEVGRLNAEESPNAALATTLRAIADHIEVQEEQ